MIKKSFSIFFSIVFVFFTIVPSILVLVDECTDATIVYSLGEEEPEKEENEGRKKIEVEFAEFSSNEASKNSENQMGTFGYYLISFSELHLENISPPPEYI